MNADLRSISASTIFSLCLHLLFAVAILQTQQLLQASGPGLEIELVRSTHVADAIETEQAAHEQASAQPAQRTAERPEPAGMDTPVKPRNEHQVAEAVPTPQNDARSATESIDHHVGEQLRTRSTSAAGRNSSIIELLHTKISEHKQYPYLAMRQRREGVATVEFVLHPDGTVAEPRLVQSSRTASLDRAALDAVRRIEPFRPARDLIDRPEAYRVEVVFNVL